MGDPYKDAIASLFDSMEGITGVGFNDLDGEDIAVTPRSERESLRTCAAYGGIVLKRISKAEKRAGRGPIAHVTLTGNSAAFVSLAIGSDYQLVVTLAKGTYPGQVISKAQAAIQTLKANI